MSKFENREILKDLFGIQMDCQYIYQYGAYIFNPPANNLENAPNLEQYKDICKKVKDLCSEVSQTLEKVKSQIPTE